MADQALAKVDPDTGQTYFDDLSLEIKHKNELRPAISHRIGNIAAVAELREEFQHYLGADSIILKKILYCGTHSGDWIPREEISALENEIAVVRQNESPSELARNFLRQFQDLIDIAREEGTAIVF